MIVVIVIETYRLIEDYYWVYSTHILFYNDEQRNINLFIMINTAKIPSKLLTNIDLFKAITFKKTVLKFMTVVKN